MKLKYILTFLVILFLPIGVFSQLRISGKIIDQDSKPVEYVEVILTNKDAGFQKNELSDENGSFKIEEKTGVYVLKIVQFGNILYNKELNLRENIDLGIVKVSSSITLHEVVIKSKKKIIEKKSIDWYSM